MLKPSEAVKKNAKEGAMSPSEVTEYFRKKYFLPVNQIDDFLAVDEQYLHRQSKWFIPGRIYTFPYIPSDARVVPYYDKQPVMLSLYNYTREDGKQMEHGINLNYFPPKFRIALLDAFWAFAKKLIEKNESAVETQNTTQQIPMALIDNHAQLSKVFNDAAKIGYQFALQSYEKGRIDPKRMRIVEYADWPLLNDFVPKSITGWPVGSVWREYLKVRARLVGEERALSPAEKAKLAKEMKAQAKTRKR
jgi:hypothetical protein